MRQITDKIFKWVALFAATAIMALLGYILFHIVRKGLPAMSLDMITRIPEGGFYLGKGGGVLNAIVGSVYLILGATVLSAAVSIPVVMYLNVILRKKSFFARFSRLTFDVLFGIPSIVYGAFGFTIMIFFGLKASLLGGIIAIAMLIMPIMIRALDEVALMVPVELKEAVRSLGATNYETIKVVLQQLRPGITTAILLAVGRGIGDAATVLFTAGYTDSIPNSLSSPAASLPLAIFFQLGSPVEEVQERAYASALILTVIILIVSFSARYFSRKFSKNL
jgi:phosphate transport system permease protein